MEKYRRENLLIIPSEIKRILNKDLRFDSQKCEELPRKRFLTKYFGEKRNHVKSKYTSLWYFGTRRRKNMNNEMRFTRYISVYKYYVRCCYH